MNTMLSRLMHEHVVPKVKAVCTRISAAMNKMSIVRRKAAIVLALFVLCAILTLQMYLSFIKISVAETQGMKNGNDRNINYEEALERASATIDSIGTLLSGHKAQVDRMDSLLFLLQEAETTISHTGKEDLR